MNELNERLEKVAVIGASGKMGSGISLLLLQEISKLELSTTGKLGSGNFQLHLIDQSESGLRGLFQYLREQLRKYAEVHIQTLRDFWKDDPKLVSNQEIIEAYVNDALSMARLSTELSSVRNSNLIFEAILEDVETKITLFKYVESINNNLPLYFTNTSSIPIGILSRKALIQGRLIGFHFYNPPAVQKLLEIIAPVEVKKEYREWAELLAKRLNKTAIFSHDIAGFIGNGQFIREILYALKKVQELAKEAPLSKAITFYDAVTRDLLLRPMGMFQLMDYVGLDVVQHIVKIMGHFLPDPSFKVQLIDQLLQKGVRGGQFSDGRQKPGFFTYEKGKPVSVYTLESGEYFPLHELEAWLHPYPEAWKPWKGMQKESNLKIFLERYFNELLKCSSKGAIEAIDFLNHSKTISKNLVTDQVAYSIEDVSTVLKLGFFHLYGPSEIQVGEH